MPLHCKACDAPIETDNEYVCSTCLSVALRLVPKKLIEGESKPVQPKKEEQEWTTNFLKAA